MARPTVLLVNPNRMRPPIAPIGLEYVAHALVGGYEPVLCDLTFAEDWGAALTEAIKNTRPTAVGVSVRNIDDAYFVSQDFILETTAAMVRYIMAATDAPVVLGGIGFSSAPREVLRYTGAPYGIVGEGKKAFPLLLDRLVGGQSVGDVPGVVFRSNAGAIEMRPPVLYDLVSVPAPRRRFLDHVRYFAEGGQAGIETKRGCTGRCIYCVEPAANGPMVRLRSPESIADEFEDLLDQGIDAVHLCDSEFNIPRNHAFQVSEALFEHGIGQRMRWYTYAAPMPFDKGLAQVMARAGCKGINFGVDHTDKTMLRALGRNYTSEDIRRTAQACRDAGLALMFDMLFGGPGETRESIARAIGFLEAINPDCVGLSCGIRIYPHTPLAHYVRDQGPLHKNPNLHGAVRDNDDLLRPIFYVDESVGKDIHAYVGSLVRGDKRFFHADPKTKESDGNYNYNDNSVLSNAIRSGKRGAYWHILRQLDPL